MEEVINSIIHWIEKEKGKNPNKLRKLRKNNKKTNAKVVGQRPTTKAMLKQNAKANKQKTKNKY